MRARPATPREVSCEVGVMEAKDASWWKAMAFLGDAIDENTRHSIYAPQIECGGTQRCPRIQPTPKRRTAFAYWTSMTPFMPIARCGVQWKSYLPGFTLPSERVHVSFAFMNIGEEPSVEFGMFAKS